jgi:tetratricopeptide (TPR) repeat protein
VPGVPFAVSLCLSLLTVGRRPYWQDSGLYLTAIKELGVLYPPGFALYEVLCHLWTRIVFFLEFTLAVHLFSALCAALAAGAISLAAGDLLRSRGRIFRVTEEDPGSLADVCGVLAGVFMACGFTFWSTAIYAKGYSFYYLILALLLWRMIRADDGGKPRDFSLVAALIGLAWQAHPSACLTGLALILFVLIHAKGLGWKGVGARAGVAAACALGPSLVLLPWLSSRDSWLVMGQPGTPREALSYVTGRRFVSLPGVFGFDPVRGASFGLYFWEEFLGVGVILVAVGLIAIARARRPPLWGLLAWMLPYATVTILFKIEGQHDCWFIGAWMPLYLVLAVGAWQAACWAGERGRTLVTAAGAAGMLWGFAANFSQVNQRDYLLAELYGRALLDNVDRDAILILQGDDSNGLTSYLQRVRGERPDVLLVASNFLAHESAGHWYDEILLRRHSFLQAPQYAPLIARFPHLKKKEVAAAAFLNANAECGRPLFCEQFVPLELLRPGYTIVPAGAVWKFVPQGPSADLDPRYWKFPIEPERIAVGPRRARGQKVGSTADEFSVQPQRYEERLVNLLAMARFHLAMALTEKGRYAPAANLCDSILALGPEYRDSPEIVHIAGISHHAAGNEAQAEPLLRKSVDLGTLPRNRASACFYLGEIARKKGDEAEAQRCFGKALSIPGLDEPTRREIESRLRPK